MAARELDRLRKVILALPGVGERVAPKSAVCFFVGRKTVCYYHHDRRGDGRASLWCPGLDGVREELVSTYPKRFYKPLASASGSFGSWLGVFLDGPGASDVDWDEVAAIVTDAYRTVAPKRLIAQLDCRGT